MKIRYVNFDLREARALQAGTLKTLRRPLSPQPHECKITPGCCQLHVAPYVTDHPEYGHAYYWKQRGCWHSTDAFQLPYRAGDYLAAREQWAHDAPTLEDLRRDNEEVMGPVHFWGPYYRADKVHENTGLHWRSPVTIPTWAVRYFFKVTSVHMEQVKNAAASEWFDDGEQLDIARYWNKKYARSGLSYKSNPWTIVAAVERTREALCNN